MNDVKSSWPSLYASRTDNTHMGMHLILFGILLFCLSLRWCLRFPYFISRGAPNLLQTILIMCLKRIITVLILYVKLNATKYIIALLCAITNHSDVIIPIGIIYFLVVDTCYHIFLFILYTCYVLGSSYFCWNCQSLLITACVNFYHRWCNKCVIENCLIGCVLKNVT